jgi:hypothetical protein
MKMLTAIIIILFAKFRRWQIQQQLKQQQLLSSTGVGFRTKLLEVMEERFAIKGYKKFRILALIRVKRKVVYRKMHTILKADQSIKAGDSVVIRYNPGKLRQVWVNNAA